MKLVVILPTYNERDNIVLLLEALRVIMRSVKGYDVSYLVVDDNSPDGTKDLIEKYKANHADVYLLTGKKEGLGKALLRGMTYAVEKMHAEVLLQMDADLSHDPGKVPQFLKAIDNGADFAIGSRYIPGGSIPANWGLHRKIFSIVGNAIVRFGLGYPHVHDWTGGFRAYKKVFFERIRSEVGQYSGYVFQIAFLHKAIQRGATIAEVPINFTDRRFGRSKIAPTEYIRNVLAYVISAGYRSRRVRSFIKFLIVGSIGFIINTVLLEIVVHLGFHPALGSVIGAECAIISNYRLNNRWTFRDRKIGASQRLKKFIQFNGTSTGAIVIQATSVFVGTHLYGFSSYRAFYVVGVLIGLVWNYTMYSKVIWKNM